MHAEAGNHGECPVSFRSLYILTVGRWIATTLLSKGYSGMKCTRGVHEVSFRPYPRTLGRPLE
ncbi:protein of unknown function [Bradyrhizobium vignae]|uniref:Uncharacterized protein n=1 Tax=Bradyrhizobium vignae TaxID=1549949 RepID=A0A2U3PUH9_9BRAD|nr:protein of unknown function [Bradyrhizobium vignae]